MCNEGQIITDGAGIIDIRKGPTRNRSNATEEEKIVSKREVIRENQLVGGNCPGSVEVCCKMPTSQPIAEISTPLQPLGPKHVSTCGVRNADGLNVRITNFKDNESQYAEFPWMVAVLKPSISATTGKASDAYQCGGSLIHPSVVLTAAHCVVG